MVPSPDKSGALYRFADGCLGFWSSFETQLEADGAAATVALRSGDEHWVVIGWKICPGEWSCAKAREVFRDARRYWHQWALQLKVPPVARRASAVRRSALTVQLLGHAHSDCTVAALTTSLPERLGGDRNYDYRFSWIRDGSLSLALLARLGKAQEVERYLDWLCARGSATQAPLQVCYRLDGKTELKQRILPGVQGYRGSRPVLVGNRAATQRQQGSLGFLADCLRIYFDHGGAWREPYWQLLKRVADYTAEHWHEPDSGIWELPHEAHFIASRVMSWVVLKRATHIAERTGQSAAAAPWAAAAEAIHAEVMDEGWCETKHAFRQRYGSDALDASALLIPLMEFLPVDHPRSLATLEALERELVVDGLMHRFDPRDTLGTDELPVAEFEGAFLPCVFWHAHTLAKAGNPQKAEDILRRCEAISGETGLFAEEANARDRSFLGNTPLLFSHVEYVRALLEVGKAHARTTRAATRET